MRKMQFAFFLAVVFFSGFVFSAQDIAYLRLTDGIWQIWVVDEKGINHRQITKGQDDYSRVSWYPDRHFLLGSRNDGKLIVLDLKGKVQKQLEIGIEGVFDAQVSPDGKSIVYTASSTMAADNNDLWISSIDGKKIEKITNQEQGISQTPSWSGDGNAVVFALGHARTKKEIWLFDIKSNSRQQLTLSNSISMDPVLNKKKQIIYSSNIAGNYDLMLATAFESPQFFVKSPYFEAQPSWSPDGNKVAFYRQEKTMRRIWIRDLHSQQEYPVTPEAVASRYPAWSR